MNPNSEVDEIVAQVMPRLNLGAQSSVVAHQSPSPERHSRGETQGEDMPERSRSVRVATETHGGPDSSALSLPRPDVERPSLNVPMSEADISLAGVGTEVSGDSHAERGAFLRVGKSTRLADADNHEGGSGLVSTDFPLPSAICAPRTASTQSGSLTLSPTSARAEDSSAALALSPRELVYLPVVLEDCRCALNWTKAAIAFSKLDGQAPEWMYSHIHDLEEFIAKAELQRESR